MRPFSMGFLVLAALIAVTSAGATPPPAWEGVWVFSDCGKTECTTIEVEVTEKSTRAEVRLTPARGWGKVWQEDAHLRGDGALDVESGIVGVEGLETLVTLVRHGAGATLHYRAMESPNGHAQVHGRRR